MKKNDSVNTNICVVGLGYVGLPLFCLLSSKYRCIGIDQNMSRVAILSQGHDDRNCVEESKIKSALKNSIITSSWTEVEYCNIYIITVPTPVDKKRRPDTSALEDVCENLSSILKKDDIVIFESTVFPGATEELCLPILENGSGLKLGDFSLGYSPERVNVGDNLHQLANTPKIVSASDEKSLESIYKLYSSIIDSAIIKASSIKVAEASKMYENVQRDLLIALANEYSEYCDREQISIEEVTSCASSKWNFSIVNPGLVGGHCIGVDPYYLLYRASAKGMNMSLVQNARQINERKPLLVAQKINNRIRELDLSENAKILLLGFSYKPNNSDIRNTKVIVVLKELIDQGFHVSCYDPLVNKEEVFKEHGVNILSSTIDTHIYDLIVVMVEHDVFNPIIRSCNSSNIVFLRNLL